MERDDFSFFFFSGQGHRPTYVTSDSPAATFPLPPSFRPLLIECFFAILTQPCKSMMPRCSRIVDRQKSTDVITILMLVKSCPGDVRVNIVKNAMHSMSYWAIQIVKLHLQVVFVATLSWKSSTVLLLRGAPAEEEGPLSILPSGIYLHACAVYLVLIFFFFHSLSFKVVDQMPSDSSSSRCPCDRSTCKAWASIRAVAYDSLSLAISVQRQLRECMGRSG